MTQFTVTYLRERWTYCYIPAAQDEKSRAEMWGESVDSQGKGGMGWFANESKIIKQISSAFFFVHKRMWPLAVYVGL